jgi:aspartyl-tRNA synthetase
MFPDGVLGMGRYLTMADNAARIRQVVSFPLKEAGLEVVEVVD